MFWLSREINQSQPSNQPIIAAKLSTNHSQASSLRSDGAILLHNSRMLITFDLALFSGCKKKRSVCKQKYSF